MRIEKTSLVDFPMHDPIDIELRLRAWRAATIKALVSSALSSILVALREAPRRAGDRFAAFRRGRVRPVRS